MKPCKYSPFLLLSRLSLSSFPFSFPKDVAKRVYAYQYVAVAAAITIIIIIIIVDHRFLARAPSPREASVAPTALVVVWGMT